MANLCHTFSMLNETYFLFIRQLGPSQAFSSTLDPHKISLHSVPKRQNQLADFNVLHLQEQEEREGEEGEAEYSHIMTIIENSHL